MLSMMDKINERCEENGINHSLVGRTLLGKIRLRGNIKKQKQLRNLESFMRKSFPF